MRAVAYCVLNIFFHLLHISIILFATLAWMVPALLPFHLALLVATLSSWFVLGHWLGRGYCPISDWHWKIKSHLGPGKPRGTYIHLLLENMSGRQLDSGQVDSRVVSATLLLTALSALLNLAEFNEFGNIGLG